MHSNTHHVVMMILEMTRFSSFAGFEFAMNKVSFRCFLLLIFYLIMQMSLRNI